MLLIYVITLLLVFWNIKKRPEASMESALSVEQTTMIKGLFVLLIFASHVSQHLDLSQSSDLLTRGYSVIRNKLGQLIVAPFLFYSGYGIRCAIERKGEPYLRAFPKQRILRTYVHTVLILLLFLLTQLVLGERYSFGKILFGFLLWDSFGNSNWYMFAILMLYLFTWLGFRFVQNRKASILLWVVLTVGYCLALYRIRDSYWYNTVFVYCYGLAYPDLKRFFDHRQKENKTIWLLCCVLFALLTIVLTFSRVSVIPKSLCENVRAITAMTFINLFLRRVRLGNRVLYWFGTHVFECYLIQRLPMIVFTKMGVQQISVAMFIFACAAATVILAAFCKRVLNAMDRKVFSAV